MKKLILICNAGSATLKFKLFDYSLNQIASGNFEKIGLPGSFLKINKRYKRFGRVKTHSQALKHILNELRDNKQAIRLIGHRVVHGGEQFIKPTLVTKKVWHQIAKYNELAPLHNPSSLKVIQASFKILPKAQNIAVFDTAFYASLTPEQFLYALPYEFYRRHKIRRYGFHGISHKYVAGQAAKKLNKPLKKINLITVHLGNGCSITAVKKGRPIATSMGFTPLEGLVMGTRSGNIDPALPLFIQRKFKLGYDKVEKILNKESGLLGISGFTSDMREILKAAGYPVIDYHGRTKFTKQ
ncbi:acetate/propionate family kinase, partial [Patescibacteria group bacterium]|nr:acetate/propionate family kinase [Patescibacteria group bacterium]